MPRGRKLKPDDGRAYYRVRNKWYTTGEIAEMTGVSRSAIHKRIKRGETHISHPPHTSGRWKR